MSCSVSPETDCPFVRCYEEVKCEKDLWTLGQSLDGQVLPKVGPLLIGLSSPFSRCVFVKCLDYGVGYCDFEFRLHRHARRIFARW